MTSNIRVALVLVGSLMLVAVLWPGPWNADRAGNVLAEAAQPEPQAPCPEDLAGWRQAQRIAGVSIEASRTCVADNPHAVAAFVRGTNNVPDEVLMAAGLAPDAVEKGRDLDGDGDADEIHIRLEVVELNGGSPESPIPPVRFAVAPGFAPSMWVFAPKSFGMATENVESNRAHNLLRPPSPSIRIEQGDRVKITLENGHYMPHTLHFHGVDHPFLDQSGEGNEGVPLTSELPVGPGSARTYDLEPRQSGTMFYHCHVQTQSHMMMGLQGLFIVEENLSENHLQTLNTGAGHVRAPSRALREEFDREYDLHYADLDRELNQVVQESNDPAVVTEWLHGAYNISQGQSDFFTLNGRSFPYTFQESLIIVKADERVKLRVANGGSAGVALHTHGHKTTATHLDGVAVNTLAQQTRDVFWLATAQRLDLTLDTTNDGLHSYGSGVWLLHDHQGRTVTNDGTAPGGNLSAIVYDDYLDDGGWPVTFGEDLSQYFNEDFYRRDSPEQAELAAGLPGPLLWRLLALGLAVGMAMACLTWLLARYRGKI